jgi:selenocysteine lyase/cysteine desulfurase
VTTAVEHHANLLPWRRHARIRVVDVGEEGTFDVADVVAALDERPAPRVLTVTGASNVTGWLPDLRGIAAAARDRGVLVVVDGAQLVPHRPVDMAATGIDVLAFSGHKMHAPFGAGGLVVPRGLLADGEPFLVGGGAVKAVSFDEVVWADCPDRDDAGSPNVVGVVALAAACRALSQLGMATVAAHERSLARRVWAALDRIPGLRTYTLWPSGSVDRVGVATFNLDGYRHPLLAAVLSAEHAIGVRHGCFCAHPLITRLLGLPEPEVQRLRAAIQGGGRPALPGAVRASLGLGATDADADRLTAALADIAARGPRRRYEYVADHDEYLPADDRGLLAA